MEQEAIKKFKLAPIDFPNEDGRGKYCSTMIYSSVCNPMINTFRKVLYNYYTLSQSYTFQGLFFVLFP